MALIAEEIIQEWLNRKGYFTIRGIKLGYHEIDILAVKLSSGETECRHVEVQVSHRPVSYISDSNASAKSAESLSQSVQEWIEKKFDLPEKTRLKNRLAQGAWTKELVYHQVKHPEEIDEIARMGITVHRFSDVIKEMRSRANIVRKAVGADLLEMFLFATPDETEND